MHTNPSLNTRYTALTNHGDKIELRQSDEFVNANQNDVESRRSSRSIDGAKRMGPVKTFFAIMKAYCAINVLLLPKAYTTGGYLFSPLALMTGCFFESTAAVKLTQIARKY